VVFLGGFDYVGSHFSLHYFVCFTCVHMKIGNLNSLNANSLTQVVSNLTGSLQVFDLEHDPKELHRMMADVSQFMLVKLPSGDENLLPPEGDQHKVKLTFADFRTIATYIKEWISIDIHLTMRSDAATRTIQDAAALPCATRFQSGSMCVKCQCTKRRYHKTVQSDAMYPGRKC
jgi:hypothetical protein